MYTFNKDEILDTDELNSNFSDLLANSNINFETCSAIASTPIKNITSTTYLPGAGSNLKITFDYANTNLNNIYYSYSTDITSYLFYDMAYGNNLYLMVDSSGAIAQSSSATDSWTIDTSTTTSTLYSVNYHRDSTFLITGASGLILTSTDASAWTTQTSGSTETLRDSDDNDSVCIVVGSTGTILASTNFTTWTTQTSGVTEDLNSVCWDDDNSLWIVVGNSGTILTSSDANTWTAQTSGISTDLLKVKKRNGLLIACGASGVVLTSEDGSTWTSITTGTTNKLRDFDFGNGTYSFIDNTASPGVIFTTTDLINFMSNSLTGSTVYCGMFDDNENSIWGRRFLFAGLGYFWYQPLLQFKITSTASGSSVTTWKSIWDDTGNPINSLSPAYFPSDCEIEFYDDGEHIIYKNTIVDSYVSGTSWYNVWSNGWVEQGNSSTSIITQNTTITYLIPMLDTNYYLGGVGFVIANHGQQNVPSKTTTGFTTSSNVSNCGTNWWEVKGYAVV